MNKKFFSLLGLTAILSFTTACNKDEIEELVSNNYECVSLYQDRVNFGAKFEPKGNYILHGAGQDQSGITITFDRYVEAMGRGLTPAFSMGYVAPHHRFVDWGMTIKNGLNKYDENSQYIMMQIGVHFNRDENPDEAYYDKIASGQMDAEVKGVINVLKGLKRPILCRAGFEFNGEWNGYTNPLTYKSAFKRFAQLIDECNATNIALVWCLNPDGRYKNFMDYYPGDEYVDWFGFDIFRIGSVDDQISKNFLLQANAHKKPVLIGEATPMTYDITKGQGWNEWFVKYFNFIKNNPVIKATSYINWYWSDYPQWSNWGDSRMEAATDQIRNSYKAELSDPIYLHAQPKSQMKNYLYGLGTLVD